jgi:hypothetical protein
LKDKQIDKLVRKHREDGASAVTEADQRRWLLPARSGWPDPRVQSREAPEGSDGQTGSQLPRRDSSQRK